MAERNDITTVRMTFTSHAMDVMRNQKSFMILAFNFSYLSTVVTAQSDYKADWIIYALN